jgi:cytochrome P450
VTQSESLDRFLVPLEQFVADPYPVYRRLRAEAPVYWDGRSRAWLLTRYNDVNAALRDPRFRSFQSSFADRAPDFDRITNEWVLLKNPPEHTRLRALINKAFLPRIVEQLLPHIRQTADRLLDRAEAAGRLELIADLAFPLPVAVIAQLLGAPAEDQQRFHEWSHAFVATVDPSDRVNPETLAQGNQAILAFERYIAALVEAKRRQPGDDLISALIAAEEGGSRLSTPELIGMCILLLIAGQEATVNLIANGTLALLRNPEQMALLRARPELIGSAVEEFLRYDSPVQFLTRITAEDIVLEGQTISKGSDVFLVLAAANHDPEHFADPERLDITRANNRHLAFGAGIHFCVGAALARAEAQIAVGTLLRRMPKLRLATDTVEWRPTIRFHALKALHLAF